MVSAGAAAEHAVAALADGSVWTWGDWRFNAALGYSLPQDAPYIPREVPGISDVAAVAAGRGTTVALRRDGTVWAWGENTQLGDGTTASQPGRYTPGQVSGLTDVIAVSAGNMHSLALKRDGTVWGWGSNGSGALGIGPSPNPSLPYEFVPVQITSLPSIRSIVATGAYAMASDVNGEVWAWGDNFSGQMGDGTTTTQYYPVKVNGVTNVRSVAGSHDTAYAVTNDDRVFGWGAGYVGDSTNQPRPTPVQLPLAAVRAVAGGFGHTVAVLHDGSVYGWGLNTDGELGDGTTETRMSPTPVPAVTADVIAAGSRFTITGSEAGITAWGKNSAGTMGMGCASECPQPTPVTNMTDAVDVSAGGLSSAALRNDGTVWTWGFGHYGQLGTGSTVSAHEPGQVPGLSGMRAISVGTSHVLALAGDGTVRTWGANLNGQLGTGSTSDSLTPATVVDLTGIVAISAGGSHSLALRADGSVWGWGHNGTGALGTGVVGAVEYRPVRAAAAMTDIVAIDAGSSHSLVLRSDGSVWSFGWNRNGQLGNGTKAEAPEPVPWQVTGLSGISGISAENDGSAAFRVGGSVWAWGDDAPTPTALPAVGGSVVEIAAGRHRTVAVRTGTGDVWDTSLAAGAKQRAGITAQTAIANASSRTLSAGAPTFIAAPPESMRGRRQGQSTVADPVDTASGNFIHEETDIASPSGVYGMAWERTYNSRSAASGPLGRGWISSFSDTVSSLPEGGARLTKADGRVIEYAPDGSGGYRRPADEPGELSRLVDGTWRLANFGGDVWAFDVDGRLSSKTNWDGQTVLVRRDTAGRITSIESSTGASLALTYSGDALVGVASDDGRSVAYTYSATSGFLERATWSGGVTNAYGTDAAGRVISVTDAAGVNIVTNTYDADGRVATQTTGADGSATVFTYETVAATTYVTDSASGQTLVYRHDEGGRVLSVRDAAFAVVNRSYDPATGYLTGITNRLGGTTARTLDAHANVTSSVDAAGVSRSATFDSRDRPVTITDPATGPITYTYTGANRVPTTMADAAGRTTTYEVTDGLVTKETDPDGVVTTYAYGAGRRLGATTVAPGTLLAATTTYTYDSTGRVRTVTDPENGVVTTTYNAAGLVESVTDARNEVTSYTYDAAGRLLTTTAPGGAVTSHAYDTSGRLRTTTSPRGKTTTFGYDAMGRQSTTTHPDTKVETTAYGVMGRLTALRDELARTTGYAYDADGNVTGVTGGDGNTTRTSYDIAGRETGTVDGLARQASTTTYEAGTGRVSGSTALGQGGKSFGYDSVGRLNRVTDARGGVTTISYTDAGRLKTVVPPDGVTVTNGYDAAGRLATETTAAGVTIHEYDRAGRKTKTTSPSGLVTRRTYDVAGNLLTLTDPAGVTTTYTYTDRGQRATETRTGAGTITYAYDLDGNLRTVVDANGRTTTYDYDDRGRMTTRTDARGKATQYGYDDAGQLTSRTDPLARAASYEYDGAGRLTKSTDASGRSVMRTYNAAGQLTKLTYGDGSTVDYTYDGNGRRASMSDAGGTTTYGYDPGGALTTLVRPDGRTVSYTYDNAGRRRSMTAPDGSTVTYSYDAMSRIASITPMETMADSFTGPNGTDPDTAKWARTVAAGATATVQANALQLGVADSSGSSVSVTGNVPAALDGEVALKYGFAGTSSGAVLHVRLRSSATGSYYAAVGNSSSTISLYKKVGTKVTLVGKFTGTVDTLQRGLRFRVEGTQLSLRVWNAAQAEPSTWNLQLTDSSVTAPGSVSLTWNRTRGAHVVALDDVSYKDLSNAVVPVVSYTYDADGNVRTEGLVGGNRTWTYTDGRLSALEEALPGASRSTTLAYDAAGHITGETTGGSTTTYSYDPAGQLTSATPSVGAATSYTYDMLGRRATKATGATILTYTYDDSGQLTSAGDAATTTTFAYDAAGRRLSETTGAIVVSYAYDAAGRLATYSNGTTTQTRAYDGNNMLRAVSNTTAASTTTTRLGWDVARPVPQLVEMVAETPTTLFHGLRTWAAMRQAATTTALAVDVHGSVVSSTGTASVARAGGYDAFGVADGAPTPEPRLGYRGELTLDALVHLRARDYQPASGTFTTTDPLDGAPGTPTVAYPYHYADNDPLDKVDPLGLSPGQSPLVGSEEWFRQRDAETQEWRRQADEEARQKASQPVPAAPSSDPWSGESPHWLREKTNRMAVEIFYGTVRARTTGMCGDISVDAMGFSAETQGCLVDDGNRVGVAGFAAYGVGVAFPLSPGASVGYILSNAREIAGLGGPTACIGVSAGAVAAEVCFGMYDDHNALSLLGEVADRTTFTGVFAVNFGAGMSAYPAPSGRYVVGTTHVEELYNYPWIVDRLCGRLIDNPFAERDNVPC